MVACFPAAFIISKKLPLTAIASFLGFFVASPVFRQLESLRKTISTFEGNSALVVFNEQPATYDATNFTWKERVVFVLKKLGMCGVAEIIKEIQDLEPDTYTKAFLDKRIGVTVSQLKKSGDIVAKKVDKRFKYFIK